MKEATLIIQHRTEDPFARIPKSALDDPSLSWKAKGILSYLLGKPKGWRVQVEDLCNRSTDGAGAIRSALKELRKANYARLESRRERGRIAGWIMFISDTPCLEPESKKSPDRKNQDLENLDVENRYISKNECLERQKVSKSAFKKPTLEEVKSKASEYEDLTEEDAEAFFDHFETNGWCVGKSGKQMKNWHAALSTWRRNKITWAKERKANEVNGKFGQRRAIQVGTVSNEEVGRRTAEVIRRRNERREAERQAMRERVAEEVAETGLLFEEGAVNGHRV